ncbi:kinesin-domain-containing protein [Ascobolus immersus RN42]|uniref:Kinesin-domain-containing protein n=1 Tax=Ascobolus immersus RN42 TaxID=1160509 RepID=A0A3N4I512_ASCIM|nr:kinesin-domain-containing protein [Ascobolus immersus RN42]
MSTVHVVARIRPLLNDETENNIIVKAEGNVVSIPNPRNKDEIFKFPFNAVHGMEADQAAMFSEVSPALKHLFAGNDVQVFAYGVTGTGKTHTMRGGKQAAQRGIIPRLLHAIFRRKKELEKKSGGETKVSVVMTYFEIYNDKVFDLFSPTSKRTPAGLPVRECDKKTIVVGLTEKAVSSPAEFEELYDKANDNRSTSATKLNAHSSRSHAITCVKVIIEGKEGTKAGTVSAIDLAGSEDNRRTANDKERMLESQSINRSLFVLAQCVDAIAKKQSRIPFRDSKMTRILSLGQNNCKTIMILNLAPTVAYHLDTISSLNFANRAKKIETKEVEHETFQAPPPPTQAQVAAANRQPLRPVQQPARLNPGIKKPTTATTTKSTILKPKFAGVEKKPLQEKKPSQDRPRLGFPNGAQRPSAASKPHAAKESQKESGLSSIQASIEEMKANHQREIEKLRKEIEQTKEDQAKKMEQMEVDEKTREAKMYCLIAKQHTAADEYEDAILNYKLALKLCPDHPKILVRIKKLKMLLRKAEADHSGDSEQVDNTHPPPTNVSAPAPKKSGKKLSIFRDPTPSPGHQSIIRSPCPNTPRTRQIIQAVLSESLPAITKLAGIGPKKAETIITHVRGLKAAGQTISSLSDIMVIPGIGKKQVEKMQAGLLDKENVNPLPPISQKLLKNIENVDSGSVRLVHPDTDLAPIKTLASEKPPRKRKQLYALEDEDEDAVQSDVSEYVDEGGPLYGEKSPYQSPANPIKRHRAKMRKLNSLELAEENAVAV